MHRSAFHWLIKQNRMLLAHILTGTLNIFRMLSPWSRTIYACNGAKVIKSPWNRLDHFISFADKPLCDPFLLQSYLNKLMFFSLCAFRFLFQVVESIKCRCIIYLDGIVQAETSSGQELRECLWKKWTTLENIGFFWMLAMICLFRHAHTARNALRCETRRMAYLWFVTAMDFSRAKCAIKS